MLHKTVLDYHQIFSFDVKSLLTGVPLQKAIDLKLERIYDLKEIMQLQDMLRKNYFYCAQEMSVLVLMIACICRMKE